MRSCRWALPFGDVPMHPTCADGSIGQRGSSCQLRTNQATCCCAAFTYFCRITGEPSVLAFGGRTAHRPFETPFGSHLTMSALRVASDGSPLPQLVMTTQDQTEWGPDIYSTAPCSRSSVTVLLWPAPPNSSTYPKAVHSTVSPGRS
jgi:hypothetical protein